MDKKHAGAHNELLATVWLLKQGYEVFRNVSAFGPVDIIATKDGETLMLDVKGIQPGCRGRLNLAQVEAGVKLLAVYPDGNCMIDMSPLAAVPFEPVACGYCGFQFRPSARRSVYCSSGCRTRAHIAKTGKKPKYGRL